MREFNPARAAGGQVLSVKEHHATEAPTSIENMKARQGGSELPHSAHHPVVGRAQSESPAPLVEGVGGVAGAAIAREAPYAPLWVAATRLDPGTKVGEEAARLSTPAG